MTFTQQPGWAIVGLDMGNGKFVAASIDQVHVWQIEHRVDQVNVTGFGDLHQVYVPGPRIIEVTLKAGQLEMAEGADFSHALAALTAGWHPRRSALRSQAALMAVARDYDW